SASLADIAVEHLRSACTKIPDALRNHASGLARVGTLGPGATNLTTALVEAAQAGIPMVALTGDSNRDHSGKNMTQETRQAEILTPIVKEFIRVERGHRIPELLRRALAAATSGRPGPVILNIPEDIAHQRWDYPQDDFYVDPSTRSVPSRRIRPEKKEMKRAAALIRSAQRPVLLVGGGLHLSNAYSELLEFVETLNIPAAHTLSGKGALPCTHPLCLNLFGRYDRTANEFIRSSDLLIGLGFKFGEIATIRYTLIPKETRVIHIDISAEEIGKHQRAEVGLWADCASALSDLLEELSGDAAIQKRRRETYIAEIQRKKEEWRVKNNERLTSGEKPVHMARLCHELTLAMPRNGILLADGGFAAHWTGLLYDTQAAGRTFVANRGNASIGYGVPGGIGAQFAAGDAPVVTITGDGGFNMSMGDLETEIREKLPLTVVIVNNAASGYVKGLQHALFQGRYQSSDLKEMNYAAIAKEMGALGIRVEDPEKLGPALREGIAEKGRPSVIDVVVTRDPARMLPAADARTKVEIKAGDRPV
ncbi:MAG TPA: thiamine pyrophosphate-binding protein, partial [Thermodesulfobacteriota bacterium]|nr:thiamine pyrophosphate-binding protein [Thermodesulfobacteriota bacterium]